MALRSLRIGTRGSALALWQANHVADRLRPLAAPRFVERVIVDTAGDQVRDKPLSQIGGDGAFTKEIQRALLDRRVDVAVHSLKDLPTEAVQGLVLAAVPPRGPVADVFLSRRFARFDDLPHGSTVATGSLRRRAQVLRRRPDLQVVGIRGNVETRIRKLADAELDGLILAQAGLERLGKHEAITEILYPGWMLPAVGQGALGLECRNDDGKTRALLDLLNDRATHQAVRAERAFLRHLGGGCLVPVGVATMFRDNALSLHGAVYHPDGQECVEGLAEGTKESAEEVGKALADQLLAQGAGRLLALRVS